MTGAAAAWPGLIAGCLIKTSAVLGLALLAVAVSRSRPAAVRHFILSSALVGLLVLPLLEFGPAGWRSDLLPAWMSARTWTPSPKARPDGPSAVGSASSQGTFRSEDRPAAQPDNLIFIASPSPGRAEDRDAEAVPPSSARGPRTGRLGLALVGMWAAGFFILLLRLAMGLAGAARLTAEGTPLDDAGWRALFERFLAVVSIRRRVGLKSHPEVAVPLTWGWRRPVILMPDGSGDWTDDERSSALFHELSHVKRADFLVMLLVRTSLALFWWNPLGWVVYRKLLKEQEHACDELVLRAGIRPSAYAASLLAFRRSAGFRWNPSAALLGLLGRSSFQERLAAILRQKITLMEVKMKTKIMLGLALAAAVVLVGTARPAAGREAAEAGTVLVETALPEAAAPASFAGAPAEPQTATAVQEKAKEQERAKEKEAAKAEKDKTVIEKKIVVVGKEGEGSPIEITITGDGQTRKLVLDKTVTITKGKDGDVLILTPGGKEPIVLKGEPLTLEIKGGRLEVLEEGETPEPGEPATVKFFRKDGEKGEKVIILSGKDGKNVTYMFTPRPDKQAMTSSWTTKADEPGRAWTAVRDGKPLAFSIEADKEMLGKIQTLRKQLDEIKAKKLDLSALEDSLKKMEAELKAKEEKLKTFEEKFDRETGTLVVGKEIVEDKGGKLAVVVEGKPVAGEAGKTAPNRVAVKVRTVEAGKGGITVVLTETGLDRAGYERALAALKRDLPEGYKITESEFEEEGPSMSVSLAPPAGTPVDKAMVEKLVKSLQSAIKQK